MVADGGGAQPVGFVLRMELKRLELRKSHNAWADYLNMSRNYWYRLRRGDRALSWSVAERVLREWREEFEPLLGDAALARSPVGAARPAQRAC